LPRTSVALAWQIDPRDAWFWEDDRLRSVVIYGLDASSATGAL
jgi:hypothetical protein